MIRERIFETGGKPTQLIKDLQVIRFVIMAIFMLCFTTPLPSTAAPGTTSFTGSASVTDQVTFATINSMPAARAGHTATLLNNGKVLVGGGRGLGGGALSPELYDPATGVWTPTGSMHSSHLYHTATLLNNGKVLVAGGYSGINTAELYDPETGTWSITGSMSGARYYHTATLLSDGKVLVAGGYEGPIALTSAELYDPDAGTWSITGSMNVARYQYTATLLNNGKVLAAGGHDGSKIISSAELYDPVTGTWSITGSMNVIRSAHTATLLNNGKVLAAGGYDGYKIISSAELYDPVAATWNTTGSMNGARSAHTATLLNNGKVLAAGGWSDHLDIISAELYDSDAGTWSASASLNVGRKEYTATLLNTGKVLIAGGMTGIEGEEFPEASAELGTFVPGNTFTGTLTLPSGWLSAATISVQFVGTSSGAAINAGVLSNDDTTWGDWITAIPGEITTTTWDVGSEGSNKPIYLRLGDINGRVATVVTGTVNYDLTKPSSTMTALPTISPATISLSWTGSDAVSGISTYEVQVRAGLDGAWTDVLSSTANTSTSYIGADGITYYFCIRAADVAGNVEDWPSDYDTFTVVDNEAPSGTVVINGGALTTTALDVTLNLSATDVPSGVAMMSFSNDGSAWSAWQPYSTSAGWSLLSGDGIKTVYAQFRDAVGNVSLSASDIIELDTTMEAEYGMTVNDGAVFTNQTAVALTIGAKPMTAQMQVSNDGGFAGAQWEPYVSHKDWTITQYGSYVIPRTVYIRFKDSFGNMSGTFQDDIILDITPPTGSASIVGATGLHAVASTVTLELSATDDVSGVGQMLISNQLDFSGATWEPYATSRAWVLESNRTVYVRFKDNAGNVSTTCSTSDWNIFLPLIQK